MRLINELASLKYTNILVAVLAVELLVFSILGLGAQPFTRFYFLFPLGLLWVNLASCTFLRIQKKRSWKKPLDSGPDLIHLGLLLLCIASILNPLMKRVGYIDVAQGDRLPLDEHLSAEVGELRFSTYGDGRPQYYGVELIVDQDVQWLEVNRPLKWKAMDLFLIGFHTTPYLMLSHGNETLMQNLNQPWLLEGQIWTLQEIEHHGSDDWLVKLQSGDQTMVLLNQSMAGDYQVLGLELQNQAQVKVMINPVTPLFYISFVLFALGILLLFAYKLRQRYSGDKS